MGHDWFYSYSSLLGYYSIHVGHVMSQSFNTIFNITIGKYSCDTTKLPAPNQEFILTQEKVKYLNKVRGSKDWWKSYIYQLCNGKKCYGISDIHKTALEKIGLTVTVP